MKKPFKIILIALCAVLLVAAGYLAYVLLDYSRIEDHLALEPVSGGGQTLTSGQSITAVTYNVGFGAYLPDYSFFMDGGTESRCKNKDSAATTIQSAAALALNQQPDLVLIQELDTDSTRSWHVNQLKLMDQVFSGFSRVYAENYHSSYLFYPFRQPIGASKSGVAVYSLFPITSAERRSLPIETGFGKFLDLDRCYSISRIPVDNGKELVVVNIHMSAYTSDPAVLQSQLDMLAEDLGREVQAGNYVICGGDFNHDLRKTDDSGESFSWSHYYPRESLPDGISFAYDHLDEQQKLEMVDSCRDACEPYDPATAFTVMIDGFMISDNLELESMNTVATGFSFSDHDPVRMTVRLK